MLNIALAPRVNGQYYLGALANFLQNSGDANVLSTPNLMTLDNEEAKIVIGNNVPFVTGSYANTTGANTVNPFTTSATSQNISAFHIAIGPQAFGEAYPVRASAGRAETTSDLLLPAPEKLEAQETP